MSDKSMRPKKGQNFKEFIEQEKNMGKTFKKVMRLLTSINTSIIYGGTFLLSFAILDAVIYYLLAPTVFIWAGILIGTALLSSLLASRVTNVLKKNQWKFKNA